MLVGCLPGAPGDHPRMKTEGLFNMRNKKLLLPISIFVFFASVYSLFSIGHYGGDGYEDYLTAESIVLDGNLALYDRPDDT